MITCTTHWFDLTHTFSANYLIYGSKISVFNTEKIDNWILKVIVGLGRYQFLPVASALQNILVNSMNYIIEISFMVKPLNKPIRDQFHNQLKYIP